MFRLAHISDLHVSKLSFSPLQFFSKRWIGNVNLLFFRKKHFHTLPLWSLLNLFKKSLPIDYLLVTGDITSTSLDKEFMAAKELFEGLEEYGIKVFFLPGNHDVYTRYAYKTQKFYRYFSNPFEHPDHPTSRFQLRTHGVEAHMLKDNWWIILLDTSLATPLLSSKGVFSQKHQDNLQELLSLIPPHNSVILANHFPFSQKERKRKILVRGDALQELMIQHPNIQFYLHGHTHRHQIADLHKNSLPIVLDSGSSSHKQMGSWNLLTLDKSHCLIDIFHFKNKIWEKVQEKKLTLHKL